MSEGAYVMTGQYLMGEDARAGDRVEVDLATGKLVHPAMMAVVVAEHEEPVMAVPAHSPPLLGLRQLAASWQASAAAQDDGTGMTETSHRAQTLRHCADELTALCDRIGAGYR